MDRWLERLLVTAGRMVSGRDASVMPRGRREFLDKVLQVGVGLAMVQFKFLTRPAGALAVARSAAVRVRVVRLSCTGSSARSTKDATLVATAGSRW